MRRITEKELYDFMEEMYQKAPKVRPQSFMFKTTTGFDEAMKQSAERYSATPHRVTDNNIQQQGK